ncbi:MAG: galactose oxidase, partial [Bacteroidota bacterium]
MVKTKVIYLLLLVAAGLVACGGDDSDDVVEDGNWIRRSSFEGVGRSGGISFVIGDRAYVGLGYDGDDYLTDFWSYNATDDFWQRADSFP